MPSESVQKQQGTVDLQFSVGELRTILGWAQLSRPPGGHWPAMLGPAERELYLRLLRVWSGELGRVNLVRSHSELERQLERAAAPAAPRPGGGVYAGLVGAVTGAGTLALVRLLLLGHV